MMSSRKMEDLGSAIRSKFLHFWLPYVYSIYFVWGTLGITHQSVFGDFLSLNVLLLAKK